MFSFADVVVQKPKVSAPPVAAGEVYLRAWRVKKKKTLQWLAGEIGTDKGTLSEIETKPGKEGIDARGRWILRYARALDLSPDQLLRHPDAPPTVQDMLREAPPDLQAHIREIVAALIRP